MVIPAQFDGPGEFSEGLAAVENDGKYGYVDKSGEMAVAPRFDCATEFSEGLAAVEINDEWGFIDKSGTFIIKPQFGGQATSSAQSSLPTHRLLQFFENLREDFPSP